MCYSRLRVITTKEARIWPLNQIKKYFFQILAYQCTTFFGRYASLFLRQNANARMILPLQAFACLGDFASC